MVPDILQRLKKWKMNEKDKDPMVIVYAVAVGMVIGVFFMLAGMLWGRL
jgi:hypothetical protein